MNDESREHISSLMDGEISRETARFLVRRLGADAELCATWARYHLVRDCLRYQEGGLASGDLSLRVQQALAQEDQPATASARFPRWIRPLAGVAVAASVALMAVIAVGPAGQPDESPAAGLAAEVPAASFTAPQGLAPIPMTQVASFNGGVQDDRMGSYLLRHYQATGASGSRGFVTAVPIVIIPVRTLKPLVSESEDQQPPAENEAEQR